jgi:hypothetical protein
MLPITILFPTWKMVVKTFCSIYIKEKTFDEKGNLIRHLTDKELEDLDKP